MAISAQARMLVILAVMSFLFACSKGGSSLATDNLGSNCPPGGCAVLTPDQAQLTLSSSKTSVYTTAATGDFVELGGNCYSSTYPDNRLEITLFRGGTQITLLAGDVINVKSSTSLAKCSAGRYDIAINGANMPAAMIYRVHIEIIGIDSTGAEFRNTGSGAFDVNVTRQSP